MVTITGIKSPSPHFVTKQKHLWLGVEINSFIDFKREVERIFNWAKETERENLEKLPTEVMISCQSGWLLGYADCWNKLYKTLKKVNYSFETGLKGRISKYTKIAGLSNTEAYSADLLKARIDELYNILGGERR